MKKTLLAIMVLAMFAVSCKDSKEKSLENSNNDENIILNEEEVVDNLPNSSDISFISSLDEFQKGNFEKAATYISDAIAELKTEAENTEDIDGLLFDNEIDKLNNLEEKVRTNKVDDISTLVQAMSNAEMLVAHDYIVYTVSTLLEEPAKGSYYFANALKSLNNAIVKLKGEAKDEAIQIRDESKKLVGKIKSEPESKDLEKELKKQTKNIEDFLNKHKTNLL